MYYNKDPTQRRNVTIWSCLISGGRDASHDFGLTDVFRESPTYVETFKKASSKHNDYPLIDLKPTTSENLRLCTCVLSPIKLNKTGNIAHYFEKGPSC